MSRNQFHVVDVFKRRVIAHMKSMLDVYKSAIDWVVWLYIIIPFTIIIGYNYFKWWTGPWDFQIRESDGMMLIFITLFLFIMNGNVRYFFERADQLFFRQYKDHYQSLMRLGMSYSITVHFLFVILIFLSLAPILLVQFQVSISMFLGLIFFTWFSRLFVAIVKQLLNIRWQGWRYHLIYFVVVIIFASVYSGVLYFWQQQANSLILIAITVLLLGIITSNVLRYRLQKEGTFEKDMVQETILKYRFTTFALRSASFLGAPQFQRMKTIKTRKRPWLFRKSGNIFRKRNGKNAYLELHIKY